MPNNASIKPKVASESRIGGAKFGGLIKQIKEFLAAFKYTQAGTHASSICFFYFMALIPILILYASLVPATGVSQQDVTTFLCGIVPDALDELVTTLVEEAYEKSGIGISMSIVTLLWTVSQGATAVRNGLNSMYNFDENRNRILVAVISLVFTVILFATFSIVLYLVFSGTVERIIAMIVPSSRGQDMVITLLESLLMFVVAAAVFAACYTFLAAGKRNFRMQLPGAFLASAAWYLFSLGFRVYLDHFNRFAAFYGSIGAVALFLFWMYWIFYILLVGAFVNRYFADKIAQRIRRRQSVGGSPKRVTP